MALRFAVGIDLGTSNTALAFAELAARDPGVAVQVFPVPQLVAPGEIGVIPRGVKFRVEVHGNLARGYVPATGVGANNLGATRSVRNYAATNPNAALPTGRSAHLPGAIRR